MNLGFLRAPLASAATAAAVRPCFQPGPPLHLPVRPPLVIRRHESSYRRMRKKLAIKPHASFLPSADAPQQDHIIFNPPAAAPSVYHTPLKFLPKDDPRRALLTRIPLSSSTFASTPTTTVTAAAPSATTLNGSPAQQPSPGKLPPALRKPYEKRYHLTEDDIVEMCRLRTEDPARWNRYALAKKFECSTMFVKIVLESRKVPKYEEGHERHLRQVEAAKARWGRRRRMAREDRVRRRELWGREEET